MRGKDWGILFSYLPVKIALLFLQGGCIMEENSITFGLGEKKVWN